LAPGQCGLTSLAGYDPLISGFALDAQINQVTSPTGTICGSSATPSVIVGNGGSTTLTSFVLSYNVDGGTNQTFNWTGSLTSGNSVTVNLPVLTLTNGAHVFNVTVSSPNGGTDQNAANNTGTSNYTAVIGGSTVTLTLLTDCWGEEVSWNIENSSNTILYSQAANTLGDQVTTVTNFCLADGCYDFNIFDSYGDGLDGTASGCPIDGTYTMTGPGGTLFTMGNSNYGTGTTHNFCLNTGGVPGCTNPAACNYNPAATVDNGTCIIAPANDQCSTAQALTINGASVTGANTSTCSDGPLPSCGGATMIKDVWYSFLYTGGNITITTSLGTLTDTRMSVYASCGGAALACNDDISGTNFASSISLTCGQLTSGLTYYIQVGGFQALTGTFGITVTSSGISGCMDSAACNYNASAICDNGSCDYSCNISCPGDFNGDNIVGISDLLSFLAVYGCPSGCAPYDLSGDDLVGASDLLIFLSYYGNICN
jgi:hypothetical protein